MPEETRKRLEVSVEPSVMGSQAVKANPPQTPMVEPPPGLVTSGPLVASGAFVGQYVVFTPVNNQLSQPITDKGTAFNYAAALRATGKPCVIMCVVAQF